MKKAITICCALTVACLGTIGAQSQSSLTELLDRLTENHMTGITEVFTPEELQILRSYFDITSPLTTTNTPDNLGVLFYAPENVNMNIGGYYNTDPSNFNIYGVSGTVDFDGAGAYNPLTDAYFAIDNAGNAYDINPNTYSYTLRGTVSAPPGESYVGLEFDPTSNKLYGLSTDGAGNSGFSEINPLDLSVSYKGNTGLTLGIALAFDLGGDAYAIDIDTDQSYKINKENANATLLGHIGFDANFGQGMGLSRSLGEIYISAFNNTSFQSELRTLDKINGSTESWGALGDMMPGGTLQFGWTGAREIDLGVLDQDNHNFRYYPNPVKASLYLRADQNIERVQLYTISGQFIYEAHPINSETVLELDVLATGHYLMKVTIGGTTSNYQLIKS